MKIGFLSNKLTLRGTEICLYDYADCNEKILGNTSIILTRPYHHVLTCSPRDVHPDAYKKFSDRFAIEYYINLSDINTIVKRNNIDILFIEKAGSPDDGLVFNCCKTIIHCVFDTTRPHGTLYSSISAWLNHSQKTSIPVLPYMVRVHNTQESLRSTLDIPENAIVFGSYGGADEYTMSHVKQVVCDVASNLAYANIYFVYMNHDVFGPSCKNIKFLPGSADMVYKRKFINTCDAMLYGRSGGETFGLACGEFSICGKPVIAKPGEHSSAHEAILGDAMIKCSTYKEVYAVVTEWNSFRKDVTNNGYCAYTEENVMKNFKNYLEKM